MENNYYKKKNISLDGFLLNIYLNFHYIHLN